MSCPAALSSGSARPQQQCTRLGRRSGALRSTSECIAPEAKTKRASMTQGTHGPLCADRGRPGALHRSPRRKNTIQCFTVQYRTVQGLYSPSHINKRSHILFPLPSGICGRRPSGRASRPWPSSTGFPWAPSPAWHGKTWKDVPRIG